MNSTSGEADLYLYPDLLTVLQGDFDLGKLREGRLVRLSGILVPIRQAHEEILVSFNTWKVFSTVLHRLFGFEKLKS